MLIIELFVHIFVLFLLALWAVVILRLFQITREDKKPIDFDPKE